jgi:ribonucleoside-diphosphate reductase alpha chain
MIMAQFPPTDKTSALVGGARHRLPNRRNSSTISTRFRGADFAITYSRFGDGSVAEIFISPTKVGSDAAEDARDAAIIISLALQSGVGLDQLRHSISRANGTATSVARHAIDVIAQEEGEGDR